MLSIPTDMAKVNQYIYADIPSAKDLYEKMGFRYVNGQGHSDVESARASEPCLLNVNASNEVTSRAIPLISEDVKALQDLPK